MKLKLLSAVAIFTAFVFFPGQSTAMSLWSHKSNTKSTSVDIASAMKFPSGQVLQPGTYKMEVPSNETSPKVAFYQNGKEVASEAAKVVSEPERNLQTEVTSTKKGAFEVINEISPAGWDEKLVFNASGQTSGRS